MVSLTLYENLWREDIQTLRPERWMDVDRKLNSVGDASTKHVWGSGSYVFLRASKPLNLANLTKV